MFENITIIGCGLIGSSILRSINKNKISKKINIFDKSKEVLSFLKDRLLFSMQIGYEKTSDIGSKFLKDADEYKPDITEIVEWL